MSARPLGAVLLLLVGAAAVTAEETAPDCSKPALRKARASATQAARRKDYKAAIALLAPLAEACGDGDAVERGWLISDLSVDYLKNGQLLECTKLVDEALYPKSDIARSGNDKLTSALEHNGQLCEQARADQYGPFSSTPCPFEIDDAVANDQGGHAATELPAALRPKGASVACLAVVGGKRNSGHVECPRLVLVVRQADGKLQRRPLRLDGSGVDDPTFCCGYDAVAVSFKNGAPMVRLGADTVIRECSGGTARSMLDEILSWKGDALSVVVEASHMVE